jgi:hypothetical protein
LASSGAKTVLNCWYGVQLVGSASTPSVYVASMVATAA